LAKEKKSKLFIIRKARRGSHELAISRLGIAGEESHKQEETPKEEFIGEESGKKRNTKALLRKREKPSSCTHRASKAEEEKKGCYLG